MSQTKITSGEWYVKVETSNVFIYNQDPNRGNPIAVFYNDADGLALANHICDTHNAVPKIIEALSLFAALTAESTEMIDAQVIACAALRKAGIEVE